MCDFRKQVPDPDCRQAFTEVGKCVNAAEATIEDHEDRITSIEGAAASLDYYSSVTDGTNTAVAAGPDTLKLRSANAALTIVVTNDDATHGDNALFTIVGSGIAALIAELLALADLSDVTAKTGTGTVVVMQISPTIDTKLTLDETHGTDSQANILELVSNRSGGGAGNSFGNSIRWSLDNSANAETTAAQLLVLWNVATAGSETTSLNFQTRTDGANATRVIIRGGTLIISNNDTYPPLRITERSVAPTTPTQDDIYLDDGTNTGSGAPGFRRWTGAAWEDLTLDAGLAALAVFNTNGILVQTANNVFAGRTITNSDGHITVTNGDGVAGNPTLAMPAKHRTRTAVFYMEDPAAADEFPIHYFPDDVTIVAVRAVTDTGTVDFNIEERGKLTPDVAAATDLNSTEMVAAAAGLEDTDFSGGNAGFAADTWATLTISAVASSPTKLWVTIEWTVN